MITIKNKLFICAMSAMLAIPSAASAQDKHVSGTVTDAATGKPLPGVSVQAYGNKRYAAMTDANGHYEIVVPEFVNSLTLTVDGYQLQQKAVAKDITKTDAMLYSSKFNSTYKSTTTAQLSLATEEFENTSELSIDPLISERMGGDIRSISRGGNSGMGNMMLIDGINSLNAGVQPLIVIDGVIMDMQYDRSVLHDGYYNNLFANINVNDIERVTVLKNGTALYGAKAANGVLLIETKRNKSMATKIDVDINGRYELMPRLPEMMGAEGYRLYASELISNQTDNVASLSFLNPDPNISSNFYYNKYHNNTDWTKETYRNAFTSNYGINVQGGDDVASYNLSVGYAMANSTLRNNDYTRFNMRLNSDISITRKLNVRFDASYSDVDRSLRDDGAPIVSTKIPQLPTAPGFLGLVKAPFLSPYAYDLNGNLSHYLSEADDYTSDVFKNSYIYDSNSLPNPKSILENGEGKNRNQLGTRMVMFSVTPRFDFNKHLSLSEHFTFTLVNVNENYYLPLIGTPEYREEGIGLNAKLYNTAQSLASRQNSIQSDTRLNWQNRYGAHYINVYGGMRFLSQNYNLNAQYGYNTGNDKTPNMSGSLSYKRTVGADDKSRDITWYVMGNYNWAEKYYISGGISAQASSRFGEDAGSCFPLPLNYKWGFFPSVNGAWVISNEKWMADVKAVNYLRLNLGLDVTGNDNLDYTASRTYFVANKMLGNSVDGLSIGNIGNTNLKWETTSRLTAGIEGNFFNNRLNVRVDYFKSWTSDLLGLTQLAWTSGLANSWVNGGKMENQGVNAAFGVKVLALKNLQWEVGASIGHYKNKVTALTGSKKSFETEIYGATVLTEVGRPAGVFYGYKAEKVFSTTDEASAANLSVKDQSNTLHQFQAGDVKFADLDGNNVIDENDRTVIGNPNPDIYGNIYTNLSWKNWTISAVFNYSVGNDVFNYERMLLEGGSRFYNQTTALNHRWTTEGQVTDIPRISYGDPMGNSRFSNRWIEDGSYLRLSDVTLSYHLPIASTFIQGITIWGSASNLFTITRYLGSNPDCSLSGNIFAQGIDRGILSRGRSFSMGVKVNL